MTEAAVIRAEQDERRVEWQACFVERASIAFETLAHGEKRFRSSHVRDAFVTGIDQMLGGEIATFDVVDEDLGHIDARHILVD